MRDVSRREFLGSTLATAGYLATAAGAQAYPLGIPLGFQAFGVREQMAKDLPGTLKAAKAIGYSAVELCSFKGYSKQGFGPLADMKTAEIKKILKDAGVVASSSHFNYPEFDDAVIDQSIEWALGVGLKYMTLSMAKRATTMDEWKQNFELMNKYGEKVQKAGLVFGYHTHADEWRKIDAVMVFDEMLRQIPAKNCQYQLDLSGTWGAGLDAGAYMAAHPGRFFSLHLKDSPKDRFGQAPVMPPQPRPPAGGGQAGPGPGGPGPGGQGPGRGMNFPGALAVGKGDIPWKETFQGAKKGGIKTYFVEMEVRPPTDPMEAMKESADYLRNLKV